MITLKLTREECRAIQDALEMRIRGCIQIEKEMSASVPEGKRFLFTFKTIRERAETLLEKIEGAS